MKAIKWLDNHFEEVILVLFLVLISVIELAQVIYRNTMSSSLSWAEEVCRFLWIASVFVSLPYTVRNESILRVTALLDVLPWKIQNTLNIFVDLVTIVALTILSYASFGCFESVYSSGELSAAILLPMWIIYVFVVGGLCVGVVRGCQILVLHIRHFNEPLASSIEEQAELEMTGIEIPDEELSKVLEETERENLVSNEKGRLDSFRKGGGE